MYPVTFEERKKKRKKNVNVLDSQMYPIDKIMETTEKNIGSLYCYVTNCRIHKLIYYVIYF